MLESFPMMVKSVSQNSMSFPKFKRRDYPQCEYRSSNPYMQAVYDLSRGIMSKNEFLGQMREMRVDPKFVRPL